MSELETFKQAKAELLAQNGKAIMSTTIRVWFPCPDHRLTVRRFVLECPACNMTNGERFQDFEAVDPRRRELEEVAQKGGDGRDGRR